MPVPQVHAPMVPVVPIGITITTVPAHLDSRERTAAMTLMSAVSLVFASMVASVLIPKGPSTASANLDIVDAHVRCPPFPVLHHSALMVAPVDRRVIIHMSVLACQVCKHSKTIIYHTCFSVHNLFFSQAPSYRHTNFPKLMT